MAKQVRGKWVFSRHFAGPGPGPGAWARVEQLSFLWPNYNLPNFQLCLTLLEAIAKSKPSWAYSTQQLPVMPLMDYLWLPGI